MEGERRDQSVLEALAVAVKALQVTVEDLRARMGQHSLKCPFSPERDGVAQSTIDKVAKLETAFNLLAGQQEEITRMGNVLAILQDFASEVRGALLLLKWAGLGGLVALAALLAKAYAGI